MNGNCEQMFGHKCGRLLAIIFVSVILMPLQLRADISDDIRPASNDTVMASILVASPGSLIYQSTGHAAIRLRCPAYGLDNVFSYETNTDKTLLQILGESKGRFSGILLEEYLDTYRKEGREVKEYPLNLTDMQIRRLWQLLDEAIATQEEGEFNVRHTSCSSQVIDKVEQALGGDVIIMNEDSLLNMDNGTALKSCLQQQSPWSAFLFVTALGADADKPDSWRTRLIPIAFETVFYTAEIETPGQGSRPLLAGKPTVLVAATAPAAAPIITPTLLCLFLLIAVIIISALDIMGRCRVAVRVCDILLLTMQTIAAVALIVAAAVPASIGSAWSWLMLPLNILPLIVVLTSRHKPLCRHFFIVYGIVCLLFIAAPLLTSVAAAWSSLLSAAIALRVLTHYYLKSKFSQKAN